MDDVEVIFYPTPSEEEIRSMNIVGLALMNPNIEKFEKGHKLSLTLMWEQMGMPAELEEFTIRDKELRMATWKVLNEVLVSRYHYIINNLIRDYPWLDEIQVYRSLEYGSDFNIRTYKDYLFVQNKLFHRGVRPYPINLPEQIYIYNLRYVDPSDYDKLYELVGIERSRYEEVEVNIDNVLEELYSMVASDDLDLRERVGSDFGDEIGADLEDLWVIVAERMIEANSDIDPSDQDFTDRLLFILNQIDQVDKINNGSDIYLLNIEPYLDLLKIILYRINNPTVAIDIIQDQKRKYKDRGELEYVRRKVKDFTDDYIRNRLKIENLSKRDLLKYVSNILYPDEKILK